MTIGAGGPTCDDAQSAVQEIWTRTRAVSLARVSVLEEAVAALMEGRLSDRQRRDAERDAHRLTGSAGTFGFHRASEAARQLEGVFAGSGPIPAHRILMAAEEVFALRMELEKSVAQGQPGPPQLPTTKPTGKTVGQREVARELVIAIADDDARQRISDEAQSRGFKVTAAMFPRLAPMGVDGTAAAIVDLSIPAQAGMELIAHLTASAPFVPILALTPTDHYCDRVEAARAGVRDFLSAASGPPDLLDAVEELLMRTRRAETTVLAVDDDPAILDAIEAALSTVGLRTVKVDDPERFWTILAEEDPGLAILDLDMPQILGDDLCRLIRSVPQWAGLPILFLTAHSDPDTVCALFAAGADDFVSKPFNGPELVARVQNRLERTKMLRALAETDPLTGLLNRRRADVDLQRLFRLAERHHQPFSIAMIDLDRFKQVNDTHGHSLGDIVLRRVGSLLSDSFRGEDVVARWGGEEFLLGMYGMGPDDAVQHVASVLETLREELFLTPSGGELSVTFSAGVASYPADASTVRDLCDASDQALYRAKRSGRNRVLSSLFIRDAHDVDVLVVEDDEALAELLGHALTTRGYRHAHLTDGGIAAKKLAGAQPTLTARVVLLDVDLPVVNGLGVLRQMATAGMLTCTKVIMLTARSSESEILEALELGAFDHVAKPFSVPVLLQRIRRALST